MSHLLRFWDFKNVFCDPDSPFVLVFVPKNNQLLWLPLQQSWRIEFDHMTLKRGFKCYLMNVKYLHSTATALKQKNTLIKIRGVKCIPVKCSNSILGTIFCQRKVLKLYLMLYIWLLVKRRIKSTISYLLL